MRDNEPVPVMRGDELHMRRACDDQECYDSCISSGSSYNECNNDCC